MIHVIDDDPIYSADAAVYCGPAYDDPIYSRDVAVYCCQGYCNAGAGYADQCLQ